MKEFLSFKDVDMGNIVIFPLVFYSKTPFRGDRKIFNRLQTLQMEKNALMNWLQHVIKELSFEEDLKTIRFYCLEYLIQLELCKNTKCHFDFNIKANVDLIRSLFNDIELDFYKKLEMALCGAWFDVESVLDLKEKYIFFLAHELQHLFINFVEFLTTFD